MLATFRCAIVENGENAGHGVRRPLCTGTMRVWF
jgi:hypothetical protein